jgi:hypothetical protein
MFSVREGEGIRQQGISQRPPAVATNQSKAGSTANTHQLGGIDDTKLEATDSAQPDGRITKVLTPLRQRRSARGVGGRHDYCAAVLEGLLS